MDKDKNITVEEKINQYKGFFDNKIDGFTKLVNYESV